MQHTSNFPRVSLIGEHPVPVVFPCIVPIFQPGLPLLPGNTSDQQDVAPQYPAYTAGKTETLPCPSWPLQRFPLPATPMVSFRKLFKPGGAAAPVGQVMLVAPEASKWSFCPPGPTLRALTLVPEALFSQFCFCSKSCPSSGLCRARS